MLQSIKIDNFKALNAIKLQLSPFSVIIGNNSSGKTTILQAISFLKHCCTTNTMKFMEDRGLSVADIASKFSARRSISFEVELLLDGHQVIWKVVFTLDKSNNTCLLNSERVTSDGATVLLYDGEGSYRLNELDGKQSPVMEASYDHSIIKLINPQKDLTQYATLSKIRHFFMDTEDLDLLSPTAMRKSSQGCAATIGLSGEKLASFIKLLPDTERSKLAQDIQKFMGAFSGLEAKTKRYGWVHLETQETYRGKPIEISSANVSDGVLRIIAFCALKYGRKNSESGSQNYRGAILLDEIEDGINNENLELLVSVLRKILE